MLPLAVTIQIRDDLCDSVSVYSFGKITLPKIQTKTYGGESLCRSEKQNRRLNSMQVIAHISTNEIVWEA